MTCANSVLSVPVIGNLLNALPKTWRFQRTGAPEVNNGSNPTYTLTEGDIGRNVTCTLTIGGSISIPIPEPIASIPGVPDSISLPIGTITSTPSVARGPVTPLPLTRNSNPGISGNAVEGSTLTCTPGSYSPSTSIARSYQWRRGATLVSSGATRTLTADDVGQSITCTEIATRYGQSNSGTSPTRTPTGLPLTNNSTPTISGTAQAGQTLSCAAGSWTPAPASSSLVWLRNGAEVGTGATYALTGADVGQSVACREDVSRLGQSNSATSNSVTPSAAPVTGGGGGGGGDTGGGGTGGGDTGGNVVTPPAGKTLAQKRAAAIKKCKKRFKGRALAKKRAACIKKARRKFRA